MTDETLEGLRARFWARVRYSPGCWEWTGCKSAGYGRIRLGGRGGGRSVGAHQASVILDGRDPTGFVVRHSCDNRGCVNPAHLLLGTHTDNHADMDTRSRRVDNRGERSGSAKLTAAQVRTIRKTYESGGISQRELGARFGVSQSTINLIVTRRRWTHV